MRTIIMHMRLALLNFGFYKSVPVSFTVKSGLEKENISGCSLWPQGARIRFRSVINVCVVGIQKYEKGLLRSSLSIMSHEFFLLDIYRGRTTDVMK